MKNEKKFIEEENKLKMEILVNLFYLNYVHSNGNL